MTCSKSLLYNIFRLCSSKTETAYCSQKLEICSGYNIWFNDNLLVFLDQHLKDGSISEPDFYCRLFAYHFPEVCKR